MHRIPTLRGRRVLVTGAAGGIGAALCRRLVAREGAELVAVDVHAERLAQLRDELQRRGGGVEALTVDLTAADAHEEIARGLGERPLHLLVNNAGVAHSGPFLTMDPADIEATLALNLVSAVRLTRALLPLLIASRPAHIVNVASLAGLVAPAGLAVYAASKFGLVGFSEALGAELAEHDVGVSAICPGFVRTDIIAHSAAARRAPPADAAGTAALSDAVKRAGISADRVADAVVSSVLRHRSQVVLGRGALPVRALHAVAPGLWSAVSRAVYDRLRSRGAMP